MLTYLKYHMERTAQKLSGMVILSRRMIDFNHWTIRPMKNIFGVSDGIFAKARLDVICKMYKSDWVLSKINFLQWGCIRVLFYGCSSYTF